jgi:deoxyribonuclease-4
MKRVGAHVSISGGIQEAPLNAEDIGAKAFAMFTKNQMQWDAEPLDEETIAEFKYNCREVDISSAHIIAHDSYLINLGSPDPDGLRKAQAAFVEEMNRCRQLGLRYLNFHPGSHKGLMDESACIAQIARSVNAAIRQIPQVIAVIENTAGTGHHVGYSFEHLAELISQIDDKKRVGVCLDTCHMFAVGYDIRTREMYEKTFEHFDRVVGFSYLKAMHLNDSQGGLGSRIDRHECLGAGQLGLETFQFIMQDPRLDEIPLILETINEDLWPDEIYQLYQFAK